MTDDHRERAAHPATPDAEREDVRRAVGEERARIARDLHDGVAHHLSIIGLQAGAAERVLERAPQRARAALSEVEASSSAAIRELRRLVVVLRSDEEPDERAPQPSLDRLADLVGQVSAALPVDLTIQGRSRQVPAGIGVAVFRIVQEALTNTLRHADATRAEVIVRYRDAAVEVEVLDDGCGAAAAPGDGPPGGVTGGRGGHGLVGMRERVAMHGGVFESGERQGGGFRVWARLVTGAPAPAPQPAGATRP